MYSMTAYSCCSLSDEWGHLIWECRSVNHRYLDLNFRMPEMFHYLENKFREIARVLLRGKVDCLLTFKPQADFKNSYYSVDFDRIKYILDISKKINAWIEAPAPINSMDILARSDIWIKGEMETSGIEASVLSLFSQSIAQLAQFRLKEGSLLKKEIQARMNEMAKFLNEVKQHLPEIMAEQRKKLISRLEEINENLDSHRLEQEMIYFAQKMDVAEEIDRLFIHLNEVQSILDMQEKPVGRRLDFLMQELNREVNTLGSKTSNSKITKWIVDLKVLIEQVREQTQNIV